MFTVEQHRNLYRTELAVWHKTASLADTLPTGHTESNFTILIAEPLACYLKNVVISQNHKIVYIKALDAKVPGVRNAHCPGTFPSHYSVNKKK
jgi:hypothetical protein